MKIVLTNPPWDGVRAGSRWPSKCEFRGYMPYPMDLASGCASLRAAGHDAILIDATALRIRTANVPDFVKRLAAIKPDLIIQELSTPSIEDDKPIAESLARIAPVAVSGPHATTFAHRMLDDWPFLHATLQGEIELNSKRLAETMERRVYPYESSKNLDDYPDQMIQNAYLYRDVPGPNGGVTWQTRASRGCPWRCSFCVEPWQHTGKPSYRVRSADRVVAECAEAHRLFPSLDGVYLDDPTTNVRDDHCRLLADGFAAHSLPWSMMARADCLTLETWTYCLDRGLFYVKFGLESANQKLVDDCGKKLDIGRVRDTVLFLKQRLPPRNVHCTVMYGLPGETKETVRETLQFMHGLGVHFQESYCAPTPGTGYWNNEVTRGLFPVEELAMAGQLAPGKPEVSEWVKEVKGELCVN